MLTAPKPRAVLAASAPRPEREPLFVEKAGQLDPVILPAEQYPALRAGQDKASTAARKQAFETEFGDWVAAQNDRVEADGIPGADLRPWCVTRGAERRVPQSEPQRSRRDFVCGGCPEWPARCLGHATGRAAGRTELCRQGAHCVVSGDHR